MEIDLPLSLYIHIPWCLKKCPYCDFNSHEAKGSLPEQSYIDALLLDLAEQVKDYAEHRSVSTIFIGGGTPSLLSPDSYRRLFDGIDRRISIVPEAEITLEANPGTFESEKFREFRRLGINRLSLGVQSFCDAQLARLGRVHDSAQAKTAISQAREAGFDNLNLDLMFGLPDVEGYAALADLDTAVALSPEHLSWYQLTLEPNTFFHRYPPPMPSDEHCAQVQQQGQAFLSASGYRQYEVSAYAKADFQCRHNRNYWRFGDYLGIGAGAHGKLSVKRPDQILRTFKTKHPAAYLAEPAKTETNAIASDQLPVEFLMNHLRLREGFLASDFTARTGLPLTVISDSLDQARTRGLLRHQASRYYCTDLGWRFLDDLLTLFI